MSAAVANVWVNDNYFTDNPEKVLGEPYLTTSRWKSMVTKYKGTREDLRKIKVPDYTVIGVTNITMSIENGNTIPSVLTDEQERNARIAIQKAKEEKRNAQIAKKAAMRRAESDERWNIANRADFFTFDDVDDLYNKNITSEEKQIFVWYQMRVLGRPMAGGWRKYHHNFTKEELIDAGKRGLVAYESNDHTSNFVPIFLYLSGNVFEKFDSLEDKRASIIQAVGDEMYAIQYTKLKELCVKLDENRLMLHDPNAADRLRILPTSTFAESYKIRQTRFDKEFKCRKILREKDYGQPDFESPDFLNEYARGNHYQTFPTMSLQNAFVYWMIKYSNTIAFKKGLSWREIYRLGVANKRRYSEDEDAFKKLKSYARVEAQRLFSIFLAEVVLEEDRTSIERLWNKKYNCEVAIDYEKVPIGFAMARTYNGFEMEIKPEKREAIAFAVMQGSGCIAYGVGLGKTWCAAFIFAQFLENGWATRPMLAVPNQVYKQFKAELSGILPHIFINDFYNLSNTEGYRSQVFNDHVYHANHNGMQIEVTRNFDDDDETKDGYFYREFRQDMPDFGTFYYWKYDEVKKKTVVSNVERKSISLVTYEGLKLIGLSEKETDMQFYYRLYDILTQSSNVGKDRTEKEREQFKGKLDGIIGTALSKTVVNLDDMGIDMLVVDEAHSMKKVFTQAKGKNRLGKEYKLSSGSPSDMGIKGFMLSQYVQYKNTTGNVIFLTATPFTNSPLEVFSMLALVAYRELERKNLNNITMFFDQYADIQRELVITVTLKPEFREVFLGFENLPSLQKMVGRFFLYKQSLPSLQRPNKIILPLREKLIDGVLVQLQKNEMVDTIMDMTATQQVYMSKVLDYAAGTIPNFEDLCATSFADDSDEVNEFNVKSIKLKTDEDKDDKEAAKEVGEVNEKKLSEQEKTVIRLLRSMSFMRAITLSPYLFKCNDLPPINYKNYVESGAKLHYTMLCIKAVKEYHESRNEPVSGQVIYMNQGVKHFELVKEYLVKEVGYKAHEIGIIRSQMDEKFDKSWVQDRFLGRAYDEASRTFYDVSDSERIKVLIGSATIREGLNLQKYGTVLYNLFMDWNPTDFEQLIGRIWRQGNLYSNVLIVAPLLADSMDIFMFQKLQEKTTRINEFWDFGQNKSALSVEDFNPKELKYALLKDARRVAEMEVQEKESNLDDEKGFIKSELNVLEEIVRHKPYDWEIKSLYEQIVVFSNELKPLDYYQKNVKELLAMAAYVRRKRTLKDGLDLNKVEKLEKDNYSYYSKLRNQYLNSNLAIYDAFSKKRIEFSGENAIIEKINKFQDECKRFKKSVTVDDIEQKMDDLKKILSGLDKDLEILKSDEKMEQRAQQIQEERANANNVPHTIVHCANQFKRMLPLLSHMKVIQNKEHKPLAVAPLNKILTDTVPNIGTKAKKSPPSVTASNLSNIELEKTKIAIQAAARKRRIRILRLKAA